MTGIPYSQDDDSLIRSREMGQAGVDIVLRDKAAERFPFSIECKSSEQLNLVETVEQAKRNNLPEREWLIVHKRKAIPNPIVIMDWDTFSWMWGS